MTFQYQKVSSYEARQGEIKKVVLLYSGGLDTSCILKWIQDHYKAEVVALTLDLGQQADDLQKIKEKALKLGAVKAYVLDLREQFAAEYLAPAIKANGVYQGEYYISTISRYIMAEKAIEIADKEGADAIAHGCTGKGNDQIRIEATATALRPSIKILAPVREWALGREEELEYARKHGIEVVQKADFPYSSDDNMWGITWESGEIEELSEVPKIEKFLTMKQVKDAPDEAEFIKLTFERGLPVAINGERMPLDQLIIRCAQLGSRHGVGLSYMIEDRVIGLKIRGVYEHPAAHIIISAHRKLEALVSTRLENEFKALIDLRWGQLCYGGLWLEPLMNDLNAFIEKINERVNGEVQVKLQKGKAEVVSLTSPYAIYSSKMATFMKDYSFNQNCSAGFIELYSLQMRTAHQVIAANRSEA